MSPARAERVADLRARMAGMNLDALLVQNAENRRYLSGYTGLDAQLDESAGAAIVTAERLILATDSRFTTQALEECPGWEVFTHKEGLAKALPGIFKDLTVKRAGFEEARLTFAEHARYTAELSAAGGRVELTPVRELVEARRVRKDPSEIEAVRRALSLAEDAFRDFVAALKLPATERELSWRLERAMRERGADALSFPVICAAGANSAKPHAIPSDRPVKEGDILLLDFGAMLDGYCSDITRTLFLGKADPVLKKIFGIVREAQALATEAIRPGADAKDVDAAARDHIAKNGYGESFGHSLGHGVGLAVHEAPRLGPLKSTILEPGMVVTVEPGIYLPGLGGVRLENMALVTATGVEILNSLPVEIPFP